LVTTVAAEAETTLIAKAPVITSAIMVRMERFLLFVVRPHQAPPSFSDQWAE
jgi:hypothetical protein